MPRNSCHLLYVYVFGGNFLSSRCNVELLRILYFYMLNEYSEVYSILCTK